MAKIDPPKSPEEIIKRLLELELRAGVTRVNGLCDLLGKEPQWATERKRKRDKRTAGLGSDQKRLAAAQALIEVYGVTAEDMGDPAKAEELGTIIEACEKAIDHVFNAPD